MDFDNLPRLIFCLSPGRCGTEYLAEMFKTVPGVHAVHEGKPDFVDAARATRKDPEAGKRFWLEEKLPHIAGLGCDVYVETAHLFGKGFLEPLLDLGIVPDVVVIFRDHRDVALSFWRRDSVPGMTAAGKLYLLHPEAPSLLRLPNWQGFTPYQLCFWYCLEMAERLLVYSEAIRGRGGRVVAVTFDELIKGEGFKRIIRKLGLPKPHRKEYNGKRGAVYNPTAPEKLERFPDGDPDKLEQEVRDSITDGTVAVGKKPARPSIDIVILHMGDIRAELAMALLMITHERRYRVAISFASANPTSNNRNQIVKEFLLNERHADWLVMIDHDTIPVGDFLQFIESDDKDIISIVAPTWKPTTSPDAPLVWNVQLEWGKEKFAEALPDPTETPFIKVASVGTGVILIRRKVLEHPDMRWPFKDVFDEDGIRRVGHDLNFCHRARAAGFDTWVYLGQPCDHIKSTSLKSVAVALHKGR